MPELPDIEVFSKNLKKMFAGKKLVAIRVINGKKLKNTQNQLNKAIKGSTIKDIYRSGKEMRIQLSNGTLIGLHLMLTGDLFHFQNKNEKKSTIVEFHFKDGSGLALTDRMRNAQITLDPEDKKGIDALDRRLNFSYLKKVFTRKANVKNLLLDQNIIRGIGNGYSDEILWLTGISPFSKADAIPENKIKELAKNIKKVLKGAIGKIDKKYPDLIQGEIRDFMNIHTKKKDKSPTGFPIKMADRGMLKTFYTDEQILYS